MQPACCWARHCSDPCGKIPTEEEWRFKWRRGRFKEKFDNFFNRFKTSEKNKYTDRLSDGFSFILFLSVCFTYFVPTVILFFLNSGSLICKQTVKRVWQLTLQTAERENPPSSSSSSSSSWEHEQLSCLTVSVSYLSVCQANVNKLRSRVSSTERVRHHQHHLHKTSLSFKLRDFFSNQWHTDHLWPFLVW